MLHSLCLLRGEWAALIWLPVPSRSSLSRLWNYIASAHPNVTSIFIIRREASIYVRVGTRRGLFAGKYGSAVLPKHFKKTRVIAVPYADTCHVRAERFSNQNKGSSHSAWKIIRIQLMIPPLYISGWRTSYSFSSITIGGSPTQGRSSNSDWGTFAITG